MYEKDQKNYDIQLLLTYSVFQNPAYEGDYQFPG